MNLNLRPIAPGFSRFFRCAYIILGCIVIIPSVKRPRICLLARFLSSFLFCCSRNPGSDKMRISSLNQSLSFPTSCAVYSSEPAKPSSYLSLLFNVSILVDVKGLGCACNAAQLICTLNGRLSHTSPNRGCTSPPFGPTSQLSWSAQRSSCVSAAPPRSCGRCQLEPGVLLYCLASHPPSQFPRPSKPGVMRVQCVAGSCSSAVKDRSRAISMSMARRSSSMLRWRASQLSRSRRREIFWEGERLSNCRFGWAHVQS
jgi:hypothetical protein